MFAKVITLSLIFWFMKSSFGIPHTWENQIEPEYNELVKNMDAKIISNGFADDLAMNNEDSFANEATKRMHKDESIESILGKHRKYHFNRQQHKSCSCNHEKRLVDLGSDYFPRYISDMICLPGGCGPNFECRPKRFKIWVMRRRQEDEEPGTEPVPKELREFWTGESIVTTIDCECTV